MGGKSIGKRGLNERQRKRTNTMGKFSFGKLMVRPEHMMEHDDTVFSPPTREEVVCQSCGFKARYQFLRCPECNEMQK